MKPDIVPRKNSPGVDSIISSNSTEVKEGMNYLKSYYKTLSFEQRKHKLLSKPVTAPLYTRMQRAQDETPLIEPTVRGIYNQIEIESELYKMTVDAKTAWNQTVRK